MKMKSAIEIALEKTKDIEAKDDPNALSKEAMEKIREVNKEYDARIAEVEVRTSSKLREIQGQYTQEELKAVLPQLMEQIRNERDRINAERKEKLDTVRAKDRKNK